MEYHNPKTSNTIQRGLYGNIASGIDSVMVFAFLFFSGLIACLAIGAIAAVVWSFKTTIHFIERQGVHEIHWPNLVAWIIVGVFAWLSIRAIRRTT